MAEAKPFKACTSAHGYSELRRFSDSFNGLRPLQPVKRRNYGRHDKIDSQSDLSEIFKVSDRIALQEKDKFIGKSDSRDMLDDELKQVQYEVHELLDQKYQLKIEMQKMVREADILTSRIRDHEAQLGEEKNESKRVSSKIQRLIRADGHRTHFLSIKRSQVQLHRLVENVGLDDAQHFCREDSSNLNIINDEEISHMKRDHTCRANKQIQLHGNMKTPRGSKLANFVKENSVRIEGSSKRNLSLHFNGNKEPEVENKRKETEDLQHNENNKSKWHMDVSKGYASLDNKVPFFLLYFGASILIWLLDTLLLSLFLDELVILSSFVFFFVCLRAEGGFRTIGGKI